MVATRILATPSAARAAAAQDRGDLGVALYNMGGPQLPGLGHTLPHAARKLAQPPSVRSWDFLSVALSVFAADRFVLRSESPDAWTRTIALDVELVDPDPWIAQAQPLADALRFLSGDIWYLRFHTGGRAPPDFAPRLTDRDCACLFSGGLDSLIGAMNLVAAKRRPFIISQASPKEELVQSYLAERLACKITARGVIEQRAANRTSRHRGPFATFLCLRCYQVSAGAVVPENGYLDQPLQARRRIGSQYAYDTTFVSSSKQFWRYFWSG